MSLLLRRRLLLNVVAVEEMLALVAVESPASSGPKVVNNSNVSAHRSREVVEANLTDLEITLVREEVITRSSTLLLLRKMDTRSLPLPREVLTALLLRRL